MERPRGVPSGGNLHQLGFGFERLRHMRVDLGPETLRVSTRVLAHVGKEQLVEACSLGTIAARTCCGNEGFVLLVERGRRQLQQDVGLNPCRKFAHGDEHLGVAIARPHAAKGRVEGFLLLRVRQFGDQECVADGNCVFQERLGHGWNQVRQLDAAMHISLTLTRSGRDAGDGVGRFSELQE